MALSRLRLRLAGTYAVGVFLGLAAFGGGLIWFLDRRADDRFGAALADAAAGMETAIRRELAENAGMTLAAATEDALVEWPDARARFVLSRDGEPIGQSAAARRDGIGATWFEDLSPGLTERPWGGGPIRIAIRAADSLPGVRIAAYASTAPLAADRAALLRVAGLLVPVALLASLLAGYLFSAFALRPLTRLTGRVAALDPSRLDQRLPVAEPPDEVDRLAERINDFLGRIEQARRQSHRFLSRAAHQLRTPLTLVLGEAALSLERDRPDGEHREALGRVRRAAGQMAHRVDELFLLARAEAGERPALTDRIELDALAIDAAELMSSRARALGRRLELGRMDDAVIRGAGWLVREAVVELLENACRHGAPTEPVVVEVLRVETAATIVVTNGGPWRPAAAGADQGLGTALLAWIAEVHGGRMVHRHEDAVVTVGIEFPALTEAPPEEPPGGAR